MKKDKKEIIADVLFANKKNRYGKALPQEKNPLPVYPVADDIYSMDSEVDVDPDYLSTGVGTGSIPVWRKGKDFNADETDNGLDVQGAEVDDDEEAIGSEDEENNYYSIAGGNHHELDDAGNN